MSEGFEGTQMEESPMPVGVLEESHVSRKNNVSLDIDCS